MVRQNEINKESLLFNKIDNFDDEDSSEGWINWFCELEGHDFFIEVDEDYITDSFNLFGLKAIVPRYDEALEMILSPDTPESEDLKNQNFLDLYQSAMDLYGLIHARFILTPKGLQMMRDKFSKNVFGACPRILCDRQSVLPIGMSEDLSIARVKVYCPKCKEVYIPRMRFVDVDGAYFGCSFPHIFLQTFSDCIPKDKPEMYVPKIYGFTIFGKKGSKYEGKYINSNNQIVDIENNDNKKGDKMNED